MAVSGPKNVLYNVILNITNIAFPIVVTPYIARVLGVENMGIVNFATAYASYFSILIHLGIPIYGVRAIAKCKDNLKERSKIATELVAIMGVSSLLFSAIYLASIYSINILRAESEYLLIAGLPLILSIFNVEWYFQGREKLKIITLRSIVVKVLSLAAIFIFVKERGDLILYILINNLAAVLSQFWTFLIFLTKELKVKFKELNLRRHPKPTLTLFLSTLAITIYTLLPSFMLGFLSTYTYFGSYTPAH